MRNLKITRSMILAFVLGMSLSSLTLGAKVCIAVPLVLLWFMSYDEKLFHQNKKRERGMRQ
jgi:Sec-independent protein secretion pathway component TatC